VSETVARDCANLRQGDILTLSSIFVGDTEVETPDGVVILSQTCDLVLPHDRPNVVVAMAVRLDNDSAKLALKGRRPRWVPTSDAENALFADLEFVATISKQDLEGTPVARTFGDDEWSEQRKFAARVARRFARLALPNEIVPWFRWLSDLVLGKAGKANSALGRAIEAISEFRVQASSWVTRGADVSLYVILGPGELPVLPDDPDDWEPIPEYVNSLGSISEVAERLFPAKGERPSGAERDALWRRFADILRDRISPTGPGATEPSVAQAIGSVDVAVVDETEFSMAQYRRSEQLDLSHLSAPLPLDA